MSEKIADIEMLRALGISFVVLHHVDNLFPYTFRTLELVLKYVGGAFGVDLFFVVSGFVIAKGFFAKLPSEKASRNHWAFIKSFWIRRIYRLWPSAWLWLAIILFCVFFFNESKAFGSIQANIEASVAGIFNFYNYRFATHFIMLEEIGASFVYWSLSLEEQFYLIFPLVALAPKKYLIPLLLVLAGSQLLIERNNLYLYCFRTDGLILGVLIAYFSTTTHWNRFHARCSRLNGIHGALILLVTLAPMLILSGQIKYTSYKLTIISLLSAVLVVVAATNQDLFNRSRVVKTFGLWVGSRSYAIYLCHIPCFFITKEIYFETSWYSHSKPSVLLFLLTVMTLIGISAELNYRFIETPIRRIGNRKAKQMIDSSSASTMGKHTKVSN